jgi:hypothetical protein
MLNQSILDALPPLAAGGHSDDDKAVCAMEALARACGLGTTDSPGCASPVIGAFCRSLNDSLPNDGERDRLIRPLLPLMVGTADDGKDAVRMYLCADRAVRVFAADALESAGLLDEAKKLRAVAPVVDAASAARSAAAAAAESAAARPAAWSAAAAAAAAAARSAAARSAWSAAAAAWSAAAARPAAAGRSAAAESAYNEKVVSVLKELCEV